MKILNKPNTISVFKYLLLLLITVSLSAQVNQEWTAGYLGTGNNDDIVNSMAYDDDGNVYVTGPSVGSGTGYDYVTIKYNAEGVQQWIQVYNNALVNGDDKSYAIAVNNDGVYVTGESRKNNGLNAWYTIKYSKDGAEQWNRTYAPLVAGNSRATVIALDYEGNVVVSGYSPGDGTGFDFATIKYNSQGVEQWRKTYNGTGNGTDIVNAISILEGDLVLVTGSSVGTGGVADYLTILYHRDGTEQWVKRYGGSGGGNDVAQAITWNRTSSLPLIYRIFVTGYSRGTGGIDDYTTVCYDLNGNENWVKRYYDPNEGRSHSRAFGIATNNVGDWNVAVTGQSTDDYATVVYDINGNEVWTQRYNGTADGNDLALAVAVDGNASVYVAGRSEGTNTRSDCVVLKYTRDGNLVWEQRYDGPAHQDDMGTSIAVRDNQYPNYGDQVYVAGYRDGIANIRDFMTLRYSDTGLDWCNVQWPPLGTINQGEDFTVYAQSWNADFPGYVGVTPSLTAWIGVSKVRTNPAGWHITGGQWVLAEFNEDKGNNDEFMAEIGSGLEPGTYYYASRFQNGSGDYSYGGYASEGGGFWDGIANKSGVLVVNGTTSVEDENLPTEYSLEQNYPNPFNPSTTIKIAIPNAGSFILNVYNMLGQHVATLQNGQLQTGYHTFNFDASNLSTGVYFYSLTGNNVNLIKKMLLTK